MKKNFIGENLRNILLAGSAILTACGNTDLYDPNQGANDPSLGTPIQNVASCSMVNVGNGISVVCDGAIIGTLTNGKDGVGCSMTALEGDIGFSVVCGDQSGLILNGTKGQDGTDGIDGRDGYDGISCETSPFPNGGGVYVICGEAAVAISDGKDGLDGTSCVAKITDEFSGYNLYCGGVFVGEIRNGINGDPGEPGKDGSSCNVVALEDSTGFEIICADSSVGIIRNGKDGADGEPGKDGSSCNVVALEDSSGFEVYCADSSVGIIRNGKDGADGEPGKDGSDGKPGKDGSSCNIVPLDSMGFEIYCADTLVGVIRNGKDGADGISTRDTIIERDSIWIKDTLYAVVYDTLVVSRKDTVVLSAQDTLLISKKDTLVISKSDTVLVKDTLVINEAVGCNIVSTTLDGLVTIACGKDTTQVQATVNINYNNGKLDSTSFAPIIVYVSSSSVASPSSSAQVEIRSSSSLNYNVDLKVTVSCVGPVWSPSSSYSGCQEVFSIYRGDSVVWRMRTSGETTLSDKLESIYEWKFPGAKNIEYYAGKGEDGLVTPYVVYDSVGRFYAEYSINGSDYDCDDWQTVEVLPSLIRNCACREDSSYANADTTKWVLSGCKSYAPITKYEWSGVSITALGGTAAYTPKGYSGQTKVSVTNSDSTTKEVSCGYVLDNEDGFTFDVPGTYYLTYSCADADHSGVFFDGDGEASWVTSKASQAIVSYRNISYSALFDSDSNEDASGSTIAFILKSGSFRVYCDW